MQVPEADGFPGDGLDGLGQPPTAGHDFRSLSGKRIPRAATRESSVLTKSTGSAYNYGPYYTVARMTRGKPGGRGRRHWPTKPKRNDVVIGQLIPATGLRFVQTGVVQYHGAVPRPRHGVRQRARPLSSDGQSICLVNRGSPVRIRQGAPCDQRKCPPIWSGHSRRDVSAPRRTFPPSSKPLAYRYSITTRPSISARCISSKIWLSSPNSRVWNVGWIRPRE